MHIYYIINVCNVCVHLTDPDSLQGTSHIKAKMKAGMFGFNFEYFLHMIHRPHLDTVTWTLDYTRSSDIGSVVL
jgi:hypothetical protein